MWGVGFVGWAIIGNYSGIVPEPFWLEPKMSQRRVVEHRAAAAAKLLLQLLLIALSKLSASARPCAGTRLPNLPSLRLALWVASKGYGDDGSQNA